MIERYRPSAPIEGPADLIEAAHGRGLVDIPLGETIVTVQSTRDVVDIRARDAECDFVLPVYMTAAANRSADQFVLPPRSRVLHLALSTNMRHKLSPEARPGFHASQFVKAAIAELEQQASTIDYCEARWIDGTNHDAFVAARMLGMTENEAAATTWTARCLEKNGFKPLPEQVRIRELDANPIQTGIVYALFRRKQ